MANEMNNKSEQLQDVNDAARTVAVIDDHNQIFKMVTKNDLVGLQMLLQKIGCGADIYDENGMTPLQHAAFKGHKEMVQSLLDQGADVNSCKHEHKYTALHFGALNGSLDICLQLLEAGAIINALNSVSRTPAQMAAFVGNHECVALINNFISSKSIELIIKSNNIKLINNNNNNKLLLNNFIILLHKFIININISPIRILIQLKSFELLNKNINIIKDILKILIKEEMHYNTNKTGGGGNSSNTVGNLNNNNEILAFKYHYIHYILQIITNKIDQQQSSNSSSSINDIIELYIRKLIKSPDILDTLIKDCVREFIYRDTTIFRSLITSLTTQQQQQSSSSNNDEDDNNDISKPLFILICLINGQQYCYMLRNDQSNTTCITCLQFKPQKKCSKCKQVQYCDRECQRLHWFIHKKICQRNNNNNTTNNKANTNNPTIINNTNNIDTNEITSQIHNILLKQ